MASTQTWAEGNGTSAATYTDSRTDCNWKNIDDSTTAYSSSPITAGSNSYTKYQAVKFAGTWNSLSALTYKVDTATPGTGLTVKAAVVSSGATPSTTTSGDSTASTTGTSANFVSSSSMFGTGTSTSTAGGTMYAQAYRTQLQTTSSAAAGDTSSVTITASWTES